MERLVTKMDAMFLHLNHNHYKSTAKKQVRDPHLLFLVAINFCVNY
jgi:hypothetical protein